jgi:hypothetical protein
MHPAGREPGIGLRHGVGKTRPQAPQDRTTQRGTHPVLDHGGPQRFERGNRQRVRTQRRPHIDRFGSGQRVDTPDPGVVGRPQQFSNGVRKLIGQDLQVELPVVQQSQQRCILVRRATLVEFEQPERQVIEVAQPALRTCTRLAPQHRCRCEQLAPYDDGARGLG